MAHTTYTVGPMPGDSTRWQVQADGTRVSKHNKKRNAVQEARRLADRNDTITVQNRDGQFQERLRG